MLDSIRMPETQSFLRNEIERMLSEHFGCDLHVAQLERRPFAYQTSSAIEAVDVELDDGRRLALLAKDVSRAGLHRTASQAKPDFLHDPRREVEVYRRVLPHGPPGTAKCYGALSIGGEGDWLLLEHVDGRELYQIGELPLWQAAARWLAQLHSHWAGRVEELRERAPLLNYHADFYRRWLSRAHEFRSRRSEGDSAIWQRLSDGYGRIIEELLALPPTFLHGEFYASNVLVSSAPTIDRARVCPVDWEMAALGPALMDVAALTAGKWRDEDRRSLLAAYRDGLAERGRPQDSLLKLERDLDVCRLHVAMQWLGWSPDWTPPTEHAHDWLAEAIDLAEQLGL